MIENQRLAKRLDRRFTGTPVSFSFWWVRDGAFPLIGEAGSALLREGH